jgi:hypothetical protein
VQGTVHERADNVPIPQHRMAAEAAAAVPRPRRAGATQAVLAATFAAHETAPHQQQREAREALELASGEAMEQAEQAAACEQAQEDAIDAKADRQGAFPLQNEAELKTHLASGLKPAVAHLLKRFGPGGDRHDAVEFYHVAQFFDPVHAKTLINAQAHCLIDKLRHFHRLDPDELVHALKLSFLSHKINALQVIKKGLMFHSGAATFMNILRQMRRTRTGWKGIADAL